MDKGEAAAKTQQMGIPKKIANLSETDMAQVKTLIEKIVLEEKAAQNTEKTEQEGYQSC